MVNYQNGKIYKIEDVGGNMCYIGSTTKQHLAQRMEEHRAKFKSFETGTYHKITAFTLFETYGVENCNIVLIELCPCNTKDELIKRESHYIRTMECVNKFIPDQTKVECDIAYRTKNRDVIKAKKAVVIVCECGKSYTHGHQHRHMKSKQHLDYLTNIPIEV